MRKFLKTQKISFDPEMVELLVRAFDEAWQAVQRSGADVNVESARNVLARYIVASATDGERDPKKLAQFAVLHLTQAIGTRLD